MSVVYERVEKPGRTPSFLYSIAELGRIALDGHEDARAKLQDAVGYARPPVLTVLCDGWLQVLDVYTVAVLEDLKQLLPERRPSVYGCLDRAGERAPELADKVLRYKRVAPEIAQAVAGRLRPADAPAS